LVGKGSESKRKKRGGGKKRRKQDFEFAYHYFVKGFGWHGLQCG
jgi:hypothetical protein